ncbi:DUF2207 family protein [Kitasatospora sp. NPDC058965]|uniref:DUF2207 family protein n=1 Tax=Kitasatospora sp. NPDC058965 TaxID=3346682 RepID=UPI00367B4FD1
MVAVLLGAAAAAGLWLLVLAVALLLTRNGKVHPAPASQELGPEPESPAVVSLLGSGWRGVRHAAAATVLDLAARGVLELRQPGDDPAATTVHLTGRQLPSATACERRVLNRVGALARSGGAPIGAIAFRADRAAAGWQAALRREVLAEARVRGLSWRRLPQSLVNGLLLGTLAPGALAALAVVVGGHPVRAAVLVGAVPTGALGLLLARSVGERATPAGLVRAGHWAGLRQWLHAHEAFAGLPPAAVTVWDRYLAYGTALGVSSTAGRLLGFDAGSKRRVWSEFGGRWREVRIGYPPLWPGYGADGARLLRTAGAFALLAVGAGVFAAVRSADWAASDPADGPGPAAVLGAGWCLLLVLAMLLAGRLTSRTFFVPLLLLLAVGTAGARAGFLADGLTRPGPLPAETAAIVLTGAAAVGYLVLHRLRRRPPVVVVGEVLRLERRFGRRAGHHLAVDDGRADRTTAWALPYGRPAPAPGSTVRLTVCPATRTVLTAQPVARAAAAAGARG